MIPFFVHIPKNMGNFIYRNYFQVDDEYYGMYESIYQYYEKFNIPYNHTIQYTPYNTRLSIDHLTPLEMVNLRIINNPNQYIFFAIMREPVDRFISLCNYQIQFYYCINHLDFVIFQILINYH
jgi:hypothetical protein